MAEMKEVVTTYPEPRKEPPEPLVVEKPLGAVHPICAQRTRDGENP